MAELLQFQDWYTQGNTKNEGGLANLQIASRRFAPCICGLSSFKCCPVKRTIAKVIFTFCRDHNYIAVLHVDMVKLSPNPAGRKTW